MERPLQAHQEPISESRESRGRQRVTRAKKSIQLPLDAADYESVTNEAQRRGFSPPEVIRRRLRDGAEAEAEISRIVDKVRALEEAGFVLTYKSESGDSVDLKPLSLFILPATRRIPDKD